MLLQKSYYKSNFSLALPIILSSLGQSFTQMIDTIMVGRLGATELAAVAFASNVAMNVLVFGMGIAMALTPLTGQSFARGEHKRIGLLFQNSLVLNTLMSISIIGLLFLLYPFLNSFGQPEEVIEACKPYYIIIAFSFFPSLLFLTFKQFLEGVGNTKYAMIITIAANIINIILNYILIYGKFGAPALGIVGAGLATLIAKILMPIAFFFTVYFHKKYRKYFCFFSWRETTLYSQKIILRLGLPIAGQMFLEFAALLIITIMMGWVNKYTLAGYHIVMSIVSMTFLVSTGIGSAATVLISHEFGRRNIPEIRKHFRASTQMVLLIMSISAIVLISLRRPIAMIFTSDANVIEVATVLFIVAGIFQLIDGMQIVHLGALRGINDVAKPMRYAFISYILIALPFAYICGFVFNIGYWSIFAGFSVGLFVASILYNRRLNNRLRWHCKNFERLEELKKSELGAIDL